MVRLKMDIPDKVLHDSNTVQSAVYILDILHWSSSCTASYDWPLSSSYDRMEDDSWHLCTDKHAPNFEYIFVWITFWPLEDYSWQEFLHPHHQGQIQVSPFYADVHLFDSKQHRDQSHHKLCNGTSFPRTLCRCYSYKQICLDPAHLKRLVFTA